MNTKKYLQTVIKRSCIDNFASNMCFRCLSIGMLLLFPLCCFADDYRKETVENRVVTERHAQEYNLYFYTIDVYDDRAKNIKKMKQAFDEVGLATTPAWTNEPLHRREANALAQFSKSLFENNKKGLTAEDMGIYIRTILIDDGSVICTRIKSNVCLFDLYTPKEISEMFDKISTFKYSTPLILNPKEGYYESNMCIW